MASSVTITEPEAAERRGLQKIVFAWTSHTDGVVTGVATTGKYTGKIEAVITDPTDGPTDNYDVTITDEDGYDVLAGAGTDRDTSVTETVLAASLGVVHNSTLTFAASSAGSGKSGTCTLYVR